MEEATYKFRSEQGQEESFKAQSGLLPRVPFACLASRSKHSSRLHLSPTLLLRHFSFNSPLHFSVDLKMADRRSSTTTTVTLHRIPPQTSTRSLGLLTLAISGGALLLLVGLTVTGSLVGLILFAPLILILSPIWVPAGAFLFVTVFLCGLGVAALASLSWVYKYFRGSHPPGSDQADYARMRIYDTARSVKDYARDYGGYLRTKLKDVAPGA